MLPEGGALGARGVEFQMKCVKRRAAVTSDKRMLMGTTEHLCFNLCSTKPKMRAERKCQSSDLSQRRPGSEVKFRFRFCVNHQFSSSGAGGAISAGVASISASDSIR